MLQLPPPLADLIDALRRLPGIGPRGAQRLALHLLERDRVAAQAVLDALGHALTALGRCRACRNLSEGERCAICCDSRREQHLLCIVEQPVDVLAIEQATEYRGLYFVLLGQLSPLDGIGPEEIGLDLLEQRLQQESIEELILALSSNVEGEATAGYIADLGYQYGLRVTRLAQGVPLGGSLEYIDRGTLHHAFSGRRQF